jgi:hypothetical protein
VKFHVFLTYFCLSLITVACDAPTSVTEGISTTAVSTSTSARFAGGSKAVKINTNDIAGGSFAVPTVIPTTTVVPAGYPGANGSSLYRPGVSPATFFDVDGTSVISKPSWLIDFQLGLTGLPGVSTCATFGGAGNADVSGYYRTSEMDCSAASNVGTGSNLNDRAFMRIVLDRTGGTIGSGENLLIQVEYQASGIHLNSDGIDPSPENNLDQLWKVFWNSSLSGGSTPNIFSVFVPPNFGACAPNGSGTNGAPGACVSGYKGAPTTTKQIIIPLSAYPSLSVLQFSRLGGRINNLQTFPGGSPYVGPVNYVNAYLTTGVTDCAADSPLCLGVVIRSILLMRI